jgi:hypothetical protein
MNEAVESPKIAQISYQSKLISQRRESRKIQREKAILKANEHAP